MERIQKLLSQYYTHKPSICIERALAATESYKNTEAEPTIVKRAKAFKRACETKTILIQNDELIVGNQACKPLASPIYPDICWTVYEEELDKIDKRSVDPWFIDEEHKKILKEEVLPYWKGKSLESRCLPLIPDELLKLAYSRVILLRGKIALGIGEFNPGFENILFRKGFAGIKKDAEEKLKALNPASPKDFEKIPFYKAIIIVCDAMTILSKRHAAKAREMAALEMAPQRKAELEKIAEICDWVPTNPPRTFHEALQALWFVHFALFIETNGPGNSPGRFDQYMYPYYKRDIEKGRITKEEAQELLDCLWIKLSENVLLLDMDTSLYFPGRSSYQYLCVGGYNKDGKDATNEISYMCIQATMDTRLFQPSLGVRINKKTPEKFFLKVCELIRLGTGFPALVNDETAVKMMLAKGVTFEEALDYSMVGCNEPQVAGKMWQWSFAAQHNIASAIEFALNNGVSRITGERLGVATGDSKDFTSFDDIRKTTKTQIEYFIRRAVEVALVAEKMHAEVLPTPLGSSLVEDCVEKGIDVSAGGARYNIAPGMGCTGIADYADSLAAIKKLVFEDKVITIAQLVDALDKNFEGYEELRMMLLQAPKYGNDDDYVDLLASEVADYVAHTCEKYTCMKGAKYNSSISSLSANVAHGTAVGAIPSGRKAKTPLAETTSPMQGTDVKGPTAVLKSAAKIKHANHRIGTILNVKFDSSVLKDESGLRNLAALIKTYFDLGGFQVQFNVVSVETLRDAQRHPEKYPTLLVRVAGYSAYFTQLAREVQEDIISRTTHTLEKADVL